LRGRGAKKNGDTQTRTGRGVANCLKGAPFGKASEERTTALEPHGTKA